MKLWVKIAAVCALALTAVVAVCSALLLMQSRDSILEITSAQVKDKQKLLQNSFSSMANYYISDDMGETARHATAAYVFSRFADETGVLLRGDKTQISQSAVTPETLLPLKEDMTPGEQLNYSGVWEGRNILIVGGRVAIKSDVYSIYVVQDISKVYGEIDDMTLRFALISAAGVAAGAALIILLVKRATRPLVWLGAAARDIAGGDFAKRAEVRTHDEVGLLAEDFNSMAKAVESHIEKLEETARRQRLFIGGVTHEFKTPLTSLMIHSDTLINAKMSKDDKMRSLRHVYEQCAWLERLTQKLLKLITLGEAVDLKIQPVGKLLAAASESMADMLKKRDVMIIVESDDAELPMDIDLMHSLVVNLIDNASKASEPGQIVRLRASNNVIEVSDEGHGIPKEEIARVKEPFYMADKARSRKSGSMGLGLALAQSISDAHGARLVIESKQGKGTSVRVIFPPR